MMVCTETEAPFLPIYEDLLVNLSDSYDLVLSLLENFHNYFANSMAPKTMECKFVSAIQTAHKIAEHIGGKMIMFQAAPSVI
jgi:protein transport protein SEC24